MKLNQSRPRIGMKVNFRGIECRISAVHEAGTIDIEEINGERAWRMSGLSF